MKPNWENAPSWAQWLAMDGYGDWTWFEAEPKMFVRMPAWGSRGYRFEHAGSSDDATNWRSSLEERPKWPMDRGDQ